MQTSLHLADYYFISIYSLSLLRNGNSILVLLGVLALIFPYEHHTSHQVLCQPLLKIPYLTTSHCLYQYPPWVILEV